MKRDWDVVRSILLGLEKEEDVFTRYIPEGIPESLRKTKSDDEKHIYYRHYEHVALLIEAGLVKGISAGIYSDGQLPAIVFTAYQPYRLTWEGHEFLDAIRDANVWRSIKDTVANKGGSLTFDIIKELGVSLLKSAIGLPG